MFAMGQVVQGYLVVLLLLSAAVWLVRRLGWGGIAIVDDRTKVAGQVQDVEARTLAALSILPQATVTQTMPGQMTVTSKVLPAWAAVLGVLLLPLGLLILLLARQELVLHVRFTGDGARTAVQVSGRARKRVALAIGQTLA